MTYLRPEWYIIVTGLQSFLLQITFHPTGHYKVFHFKQVISSIKGTLQLYEMIVTVGCDGQRYLIVG